MDDAQAQRFETVLNLLRNEGCIWCDKTVRSSLFGECLACLKKRSNRTALLGKKTSLPSSRYVECTFCFPGQRYTDAHVSCFNYAIYCMVQDGTFEMLEVATALVD